MTSTQSNQHSSVQPLNLITELSLPPPAPNPNPNDIIPEQKSLSWTFHAHNKTVTPPIPTQQTPRPRLVISDIFSQMRRDNKIKEGTNN
jgi:hypothetical protein